MPIFEPKDTNLEELKQVGVIVHCDSTYITMAWADDGDLPRHNVYVDGQRKLACDTTSALLIVQIMRVITGKNFVITRTRPDNLQWVREDLHALGEADQKALQRTAP